MIRPGYILLAKNLVTILNTVRAFEVSNGGSEKEGFFSVVLALAQLLSVSYGSRDSMQWLEGKLGTAIPPQMGLQSELWSMCIVGIKHRFKPLSVLSTNSNPPIS